MVLAAMMTLSLVAMSTTLAGAAAASTSSEVEYVDAYNSSASVIFQGQDVYIVGEAVDEDPDATFQLRSVDSFDGGDVDSSSFEEELQAEWVGYDELALEVDPSDTGLPTSENPDDDDDVWAIEVDTSGLDAGDYFVRGGELESSPAQEDTFEVTEQGFSATFDDDEVTDDGAESTTELDIDSDRGTYSVTVSADGDLDDDELLRTVFEESDSDAGVFFAEVSYFLDNASDSEVGYDGPTDLEWGDDDYGDVVDALRAAGGVFETDANDNPVLDEDFVDDVTDNSDYSDEADVVEAVTFGDFDVGLWAADEDDADESIVFVELSDTDADVDFDGIDDSDYTFEFSVTDTAASDEQDISVLDSDVEANFDDSVYTQTAGDPVHLTVEFDDTDDAYLVFGDEDVGFVDIVYVEDDTGSGMANVTLNPRLMGMGNGYASVDSEDEVVSLLDEIDLDNPIEWVDNHHHTDDDLPEPFDDLEFYDDGDMDATDRVSFVEFLEELELIDDPVDQPHDLFEWETIDPDTGNPAPDGVDVITGVNEDTGDIAYNQLVRPLQPTDYPLASTDDGVLVADSGELDVDDELDAARVDLTQPGLGEVETMVAPEDDADAHELEEFLDPEIEEATPTPRTGIAEDDRLIVRAEMSGVYGLMVGIADEGDYDPLIEDGFKPHVIHELNEYDGEGVTLEIEETETTGNQDPNRVDFENADKDEVVAFGNHLDGELYIVVDTSASDAFTRDYEDGDTFEATIEYEADTDDSFYFYGPDSLIELIADRYPGGYDVTPDGMPWRGDAGEHTTRDPAYPYFEPGESQTITTEFDMVDRDVGFHALDADDAVQLETDDEAVVSGETNVAPGSSVDLRISNAGETESFLSTEDAAIDTDGSWASEPFDFDDREDGDEATLEYRVGGSAIADTDGIFVEELESVDPADDTADEPTDDGADDTDDSEAADADDAGDSDADAADDTTDDTVDEVTDEADADESDDTATETEGDGIPGFGLTVAIVALLAVAMLTRRRQQ
ncbi:S-layer protein [Natrarchaeobaculum sulfurireducens]|uniref:S-layer protein n=1 Tax=Natrarchaeobaculum sulfurireducens TaxID=2044521 RepID=A0A346PKX6_9EURY|nr:S-layer protein [Natrarchaeobaculum sulfurireducens]